MASKSKGTSGTRPTQPGRASQGSQDELGLEVLERSASLDPERAEAEMTVAASATSETGGAPEKRTAAGETRRDLQRGNKELQVRVRELELQLAGGAGDADAEAADYGELSEESGTIIGVIKDLHGKADAARELKEALEADVAALKEKLAKELAVRAELEARVKLLDAKAALGEQLREDLSFVEEERNEVVRRLKQAASEQAQLATERDRLVEQKTADGVRIKELQSNRTALEAKVLNLQELVADTDRLRQELAETREEVQRANETLQGLQARLDAAEVSRTALELDLTTTRDLVRGQNQQLGELKKDLRTAHADLATQRTQLEGQKIANAHLVELNKRADRELKSLTERLELAKKDVDLSRRALRAIRTAAMRTPSQTQEPDSEA